MNLIERQYKTIATLLIVFYTIINLYCYPKLSPTGDETAYYAYAVSLVKGNSNKVFVNGRPQFNTQMPISVLNTLPRMVQQLLQPNLKKDVSRAQQDIVNGRLISIALIIFLALYVLRWSTQLYGKEAGLFSLLLLLLCPNLMAHAQLAGTDVYSFLIATAICFHLWRFNKTSNTWQIFYVAIFLAIGQIAKQSLIVFYPMVFLFLGFIKSTNSKQHSRTFVKAFALISVVSLLLINTAFLFNNTGKRLADYSFASKKIKAVQTSLSFFSTIPIPLPEPYIQGFDYTAFNEETPPGIEGLSSYGQGYFLGKPVGGKAYYTYYIKCFAFKLPISTLLILGASFFIYFYKRKHYQFLNNELYLVVPAFTFLLFMSVSNTMYLGLRNVLLILPFLFVFAGCLVHHFKSNQKVKAIIFILLLWQLISVANYFPHFLPYTNEFIWNKKNAYKTFGDANLFYQEGHYFVKEYLQKNIEIQYEPTMPVKGKVLVSIEHYYDWWNLGKVKWLTDLHLEPIGHFHSQFLLFEVK